ncbi:MAG: ABC transporter ATP-binding protein [Actinomycetota bacterium]
MLEVREVSVRFGASVALDHASLEVADGEVMALLGPSGSGKSTLLRVVAGLESPQSGTVRFDGVDLTEVPTHLRRFGLMFQSYALFPHLTVAENVAFGLRMEDRPDGEIAARVTEVLAWVGMGAFGKRRVGRLSGGEQQRVALARTLAPHPRLVMLDEPVGALDRHLRARLVGEIRVLLDREQTTGIYVTHDHDEAAAISDRVAIVNQGRVIQVGPYHDIRSNPASDWVAAFVGS